LIVNPVRSARTTNAVAITHERANGGIRVEVQRRGEDDRHQHGGERPERRGPAFLRPDLVGERGARGNERDPSRKGDEDERQPILVVRRGVDVRGR